MSDRRSVAGPAYSTDITLSPHLTPEGVMKKGGGGGEGVKRPAQKRTPGTEAIPDSQPVRRPPGSESRPGGAPGGSRATDITSFPPSSNARRRDGMLLGTKVLSVALEGELLAIGASAPVFWAPVACGTCSSAIA